MSNLWLTDVCAVISGLPGDLCDPGHRPAGGRPGGAVSPGLQPPEGVGVRDGDLRLRLLRLRRCRPQVGLSPFSSCCVLVGVGCEADATDLCSLEVWFWGEGLCYRPQLQRRHNNESCCLLNLNLNPTPRRNVQRRRIKPSTLNDLYSPRGGAPSSTAAHLVFLSSRL